MTERRDNLIPWSVSCLPRFLFLQFHGRALLLQNVFFDVLPHCFLSQYLSYLKCSNITLSCKKKFKNKKNLSGALKIKLCKISFKEFPWEGNLTHSLFKRTDAMSCRTGRTPSILGVIWRHESPYWCRAPSSLPNCTTVRHSSQQVFLHCKPSLVLHLKLPPKSRLKASKGQWPAGRNWT